MGRRTCLAAALAAALTCSGCQLFESEYRGLARDDPVVAELLSGSPSREAVLEGLSKYIGHPVVDYTEMGGEIVAKVIPPMEEALNVYHETVMKGIESASTPWQLLLALATGGAAGGTVIANRLTGRKRSGSGK